MADGALFWLELVTPERILFAGMASEVMLRTGEGDASFLAGHAAVVGSVEPGVVVVTPGLRRGDPAWPCTAGSSRSSTTSPWRR